MSAAEQSVELRPEATLALVSAATDRKDLPRSAARPCQGEWESAEWLTLLEALEASAPIGFAFVDRDYRIVRINETLAAVNGSSVDEQVGRTVAEVVPALWSQLEPVYRRVLETGEPSVGGEIAGPSAAMHGIRHWLNSFHPVRIHGEIVGIGIFAFDITERKQAEERLRHAEGRYRTLVEQLPLASYVEELNAESAAYISPQIAELVGYTADEWVSESSFFANVLHPEDRERVLAGFAAMHDTGGPLECEYRLVARDGREVWIHDAAVVVRDDAGRPVYTQGYMIDITERKHAEDFRSAVMEQMAEGLAAVDSDGCLLFMNTAASKMLGWTEDELRGKNMHEAIHFQKADGSCCPLDQCQLARARHGETIRVDDDAFTRKDGSIFPVAYSAAPLEYGTNGDGVHGAVVVFRDTTDETAEQSRIQRELAALVWVGRIREALDENRLILHAQPIFALRGGTQRDELLLRMVGRDGELIPPGSFLPVAEKYGLIGEIDRWVIAEAAKLAATGRRVHANLSAASVADTGLLLLIEQELSAAGAQASNLVVELTETALMRDIEAGVAFAHRLGEIGCGLSLDDFGTGFASFTYLKKLPVTSIKIDAEFVRDLASNPANQHLVKAVIALAQAFGCDSIAEGVEDQETASLLRDLGVDYAQGYHLGRPTAIAASAW